MSSASATCQIMIRGSFDRRWSDYLGETLLDMNVQEGQICTTTFSGHPPDLSAFIGMLNLLSNWGTSVIACEYQQSDPPNIEESAEPPSMIDQR
jgi:hypothetical protein